MTQQGDGRYDAEIRWTTHGVAHIRAADWGSLGYGQGWAATRDHLPTVADQIVKVRSERARFHGPGANGEHLASDFGYKALGLTDRAVAFRDAQPASTRDLIAGYVAGYNAQVEARAMAGDLPEWCADAAWIRAIDELDLYASLVDLTLMASGRNLVGMIGWAEAPGPDGPRPATPIGHLKAAAGEGASNGWAIGGAATRSGHGIVMANPHFPWYGEARFWECHLTLPGELDVYGVCLLGTPGVQMGCNRNVAWAHTFSVGHRFVMYRLDLVPGEPTRYRHGGEERAMGSTTFAVDCGAPDGSTATVERTLWRTHHGPVLNLPLVGWGLETAFAYRDANATNTAMLDQFLGMCRARDLPDLQRTFAEIQGMPWVNTLATDASGKVWYIDASATPNISRGAQDRLADRLRDDPIAALLMVNRVAMLDGSDPDDDWLDGPGARSPGLVPHEAMPQLERDDYVVNANDSHWLSHASARLEGYSLLHGAERTGRSLRTRQNLRTVGGLVERGDLTVDDLVEAVLSNEGLSAELLLDDVVARLRMAGKVEVDGVAVEVGPAAEVLASWDRRADLDSVGAALWRETMAGFPDTAWRNGDGLFATRFDPDDPIAAPRGLAEGDAAVLAVARAVLDLEGAGIAIDAPLREVQWAARGAERVPVHGGGEGEGVLNILAPIGALPSATLEPPPDRPAPILDRADRSGLSTGGYQVSYGTSFLMVVEMTDDGPQGVGFLAYGQNGDHDHRHHRDGTEAYAAKAVRPLLFDDADIEADTHERQHLKN